MERRYILIIGIIVLWCAHVATVQAQRLTVAEQRIILDEAISTLEDYESYVTVNDEEVRYAFEQLFTNENVLIYNDLLGVATQKELPVSEYSKKLSDGLRNKKATITNVKKERVWYEDNVWKVNLSFDKSLSYANECGVYLSSSDFYGKNYHLVATMVYDNLSKRCKIEKINGSVASNKKLPEKYFVYMKTDNRDNYVRYKGKRLSFNSYNQALIAGSYDKKSLSYADPDMLMISTIDECGNVSSKYKSTKFRLKLHYDLGIGNAFELEGSEFLDNNKNTSSSFGIDFGYMFPSKNIFKAGVFMGVGLTQSTIELGYKNPDYSYTTSADVDGDSYIRHYSDLSMTQNMKLTELTVPVYFDMNITLHPVVALFLDLGMKFNLNMSHKVDNTEGNAYIYGIYPQYDNLRMDERWGFNGFGQKSFTNSDLDNADLLGVSGLNMDGFAGAGLRVNIPNSPIAIELGVNYLLGLTDIIKPEGNKVNLSNNTQTPLLYNTISGGSSSEHAHNLTESLSSVKRKALRVSVGVIIKL